ncbi:lantibiotic dehydratase [Micromonospora sp. FIMYZ51]|uniref:lantibiotic dehydratase n=1 Tax=Micromonospora sp. FIMYZ51 TaxID=3051832 RepID=UPI00311DD1CB
MTVSTLLPYGTRWSLVPSVFARVAGMPFDWLEIDAPDDYAAARAAGEQALGRILREPAFTAALTWQNRDMLRQATRNLGSARGWRRREAQRRLWAYAARYCAKNDTIGFFGPIVWGSIVAGATEIGPVTGRMRRRGVFFEHWALRAVAAALETRHGLGPWTAPRLAAGVTVVPDGVLLADGSPLRLDVLSRRVVELADGSRTGDDLLAELSDADAAEVRSVLARLRAMGVLTAGLVVPRRLDAEVALRGQLLRVGDPVRRTAALADLASLVAARDRVAAGGELGDALEELDAVFERICDQAAVRSDAGQFYAGRQPVYEDCLGDLPVRLGMDLLDGIRPALELLLHGASWFTREVAREFTRLAADVVRTREVSPGLGVPLAEVLDKIGPASAWGVDSPADAAAARLRQKWRSLLLRDVPAGQRRVTHHSADLRAAVDHTFDHDPAAWRGMRWFSPDLMLAATPTGELFAVLGELHPAANTMEVLAADAWHPDRAALHDWIDDAGGDDRVIPLYPLDHEQVNSRTVPPPAYLPPSASYLGLGTGPAYHPRGSRLLPVSALRVVTDGDTVTVRSVTDPGWSADLAGVLADFVANAAATRFGLLPAAAHRPRVTIDDLVVQRESWTLTHDELPDTSLPPERLHHALRRVCAEHGMPRHLFATVHGERKPFHVDLANPLSAEVLLSQLRSGRRRDPDGTVTLAEMLPGPDQLWLTDERGRRYTAEFRLACVERR